ncbi:MAG: fructosamine kinase family protein [Methylococcaceae bacterium]|nr:fructosamine kinase family protein [Methylococcaceae bacterium]MCI0666561.1 fructosamine kinase family protein [Methylococcaceae bacterium]MCI0732449.1 fructosamine kinase family protein [Methylococcaceae bacterium]
MNDHEVWTAIEAAIGPDFRITKRTSVAGGSINSASRIEGGKRAFFVKLNRAERFEMFEAESAGLREIAATATLRVPEPIACGVENGASFLILELLVLKAPSTRSDRILGEQLAAMHGKPQSSFGWARDNTIGSTLQPNPRSDHWIDFWRDHRLAFQLELARKNGCRSSLLERGARLCEKFQGLFDGYTPAPSLLHGDLWAGNAAADASDRPVIFDPACYYGDRESDIAMSELFGGFGKEFYQAYREAWPIDPGYRVRKTLYNLYHVLNHFNLFGGGYQSQADAMIQTLLAEID